MDIVASWHATCTYRLHDESRPISAQGSTAVKAQLRLQEKLSSRNLIAASPIVVGERRVITARTIYRDLDGMSRRITATGASRAAALRNITEKMDGRRRVSGEEITPDTLIPVLAKSWLATVDQSQSTKDAYGKIIEKYINPHLSNVRLREATTARLDSFLRSCPEDMPTVARRSRIVLNMMFAMASRYDAVPANPVTDTKLPRATKNVVKALTVEEVLDLRADVAAWALRRKGRDSMVDMVDLFIGTGLRPGELLAVRHQDVDLKAGTLTVTGTVKRDSVNGLHRQPHPKTATSVRTLKLPEFAVSMLRRRRIAAASDLVFPNKFGGPLEPANFHRLWRDARGEKWGFVEPRAFRRAVATLITREKDSMAGAAQLGHSGGDSVTWKHYIERETLAPDSSAALGQFRRAD